MTEDPALLLQITELLRDRAVDKYRRDLAEEAGLRGERDEIDRLRAAARLSSGGVDARQLTGSDTLWQGWLLQRRGDLNTGMAMARAKQAHSIQRARDAFAKDAATRSLQDRAQAKRRAERLAREERMLEDLARLASQREP
ncbi:hypothetical protein [Salipiger mucosus]|uniref:Flagellar FliJ protein n=1 Tax=Salipiger mucosus DSM 16094 TaxID=1123237 RepID=S9S8R7_9RHOB|nr:hypothetical protein [Salipiger mucosus]EPX82624.1 hypothetical protein Salmuc_00943 [Salipiger mucosus DSM 16094]